MAIKEDTEFERVARLMISNGFLKDYNPTGTSYAELEKQDEEMIESLTEVKYLGVTYKRK